MADPADVPALAAAIRDLADPVERARRQAVTAGLSDRLTMARHVDQLEALLGA